MHRAIEDHLEDYLAGGADAAPAEFHSHLEACGECRATLTALSEQSRAIRGLRVEYEPTAGFYSRVIGRIDDQYRASVWNLFLESAFGRRLAVASLALAIMMGTYIVTTEPNSEVPAVASLSGSNELAPAPTLGANPRQDAVLVNLITYEQ